MNYSLAMYLCSNGYINRNMLPYLTEQLKGLRPLGEIKGDDSNVTFKTGNYSFMWISTNDNSCSIHHVNECARTDITHRIEGGVEKTYGTICVADELGGQYYIECKYADPQIRITEDSVVIQYHDAESVNVTLEEKKKDPYFKFSPEAKNLVPSDFEKCGLLPDEEIMLLPEDVDMDKFNRDAMTNVEELISELKRELEKGRAR